MIFKIDFTCSTLVKSLLIIITHFKWSSKNRYICRKSRSCIIIIPIVKGFDMKFDSLASYNIRVIWGFAFALMQTSFENKGNHPKIIIFD
ncbi:MAG TPA: hypothetical protein DIU45_06130 [Clostridium sp.]|nr:hypothetical protein [Clostridium sp.]